MSQHTPGPWVLVFSGPASTPDWRIQTKEGRTIATLPPTSTKTAKAARADAYMLKAAPDMYDALKALVGEADLGEVDLDDEVREKLERARSAIAAADVATGEA